MDKNIIITGCLAIRDNNLELAQSSLTELLQGDYSDEEMLQGASSLLLCAARKHYDEIFCMWLEQLEPKLTVLVGVTSKKTSMGEFLLTVVYTACDSRIVLALPLLRRLIQKYLQIVDGDLLERFLCEWSSMVARMVRRSWQDETTWLLKVMFSVLLRKRNIKLYDLVLLHLQMNFVMYCQWDGLEKAVAAYKELQLLYAYFLDRAIGKRTPAEERCKYFLLSLRNIRGVVSNISRVLMIDELDVFKDWYAMLQYQHNGNPRGQLRMKIMVQLSILYWKETKPKTSRKQMSYLKELLEPNVIPSAQIELLHKVI